MEINITWNICRVCLVEENKDPQMPGEVEPMYHIFNDDKMLSKNIYECSGIAMEREDNLPEKICKKCLIMVKHAIKFRELCRSSDDCLQKILQRTKSASSLFKPEQIILDNFPEEICNDSINEQFIECELTATPSSTVVIKNNANKQQEKDLDGLAKKPHKGIDSPEMHNSDILIEVEDAVNGVNENDLHNIVEEETLVEYSELSVNQLDNSLHKILDDDNEENEGSEIDTKSTVKCEFDETQVADINDLKEINYDYNENVSHAKYGKEIFDDEDSYEQEDEVSKLMNFENDSQQEILQHSQTDKSDIHDQVISTVSTNICDIIELQEENSRLSTESNGMQTEYIVDEYLLDGSSSDISLRNSSVVVINSKMRKKVNNKPQSEFNKRKPSTKSNLENMVWICELCGNHFINRQLLNAHMKVHRQEKKHECELCSKRFITACNLQAHMRIHTGEKPFECQYCERRFSDRSSNLRHERTHTNEKPFQCKECGKAFSLATTLKKHLTVHSGERSYRCDICTKSFKLAHQLKAHKNSTLHKAVEQLVQVDQ